MASEYTGPDSLRCLLTGAASRGAAQTVANLSVGGLVSGTDARALGIRVYNAIAGVRLEAAAGRNGVGLGSLTALGADTLAWTPPDGVRGAAVSIANGETRVLLPGGSDYGKCIRVRRTSAGALGGSATVRLSECYNTVLGFEDVSSAGAAAGLTEYRCLALYNGSGAAVTGLELWLDAEASSRLWLGGEVSYGDLSDIWAAGGAPAGIAFGQTTVALGGVPAGGAAGIWLKRIVEASAPASASIWNAIAWKYTVGGVEYYGGAAGRYRVANDSEVGYRLYVGTDAAPDFGAAPAKTGATLPLETDALAASHTHHLCTRYRNVYGLESQNIECETLTLDAAGALVTDTPSDPTELAIEANAAGTMQITAQYDAEADGENAADTWLIYTTSDGSAPDPAVDTPATETMVLMGGIAALEYTTAAFTDGLTIKALVRARRLADTSDSTNTTAVNALANVSGPTTGPDRACCFGISNVSWSTIWTHDANNYIRLFGTDAIVFVVGGAQVASISAENGFRVIGRVRELPYGSAPAMTDSLEIDDSTGALKFAVGASGARVRAMEIDTSGNLQVATTRSHAGYPLSGVSFAENIEWHAASSSLDISKDLATVAFRLEQITSGGITNGRLIAARIRGV